VELREQPSDGKQLSRSVQRALFSLRILRSLSCEFPSSELKTFGALSIPSIEPRRKPTSPSDSISFLTLYMWAPDIYEGSPTPVTAFFSIAPKISISANILRVFIYGSYGATLQQIFFFCSIASMILGALAAMAQTKVKRLLAHSSIGHVGYIRTGFSCGTIEGIQSLLIGLFIYVSMTIDAFAIVSALRQTRVKYIADLGALAKTNPISAITFSITMFSYAGIPPLAGFCSKFYLFFAALGCGAYFLAPVGVVTSVIGCWAAGRLPRVSQFGDRRQFPVHRTRSLPYQLRHGWECMLRKRGSSLIHQPSVYSISLYESTITTRDEPWVGEF
jgi:NADH-ubiquinone oxidoreductase chain 2